MGGGGACRRQTEQSSGVQDLSGAGATRLGNDTQTAFIFVCKCIYVHSRI